MSHQALNELTQLIHSLHRNDEAELASLDEQIERVAREYPAEAIEAGMRYVQSPQESTRVAAALSIGRGVEQTSDLSLVETVKDRLLAQLRKETSAWGVDALATALLHALLRNDGFDDEFRLAKDSSANCRLAAAMSLSLSSPTPAPADVALVLMQLSEDPDARVRLWAQDAEV